MRRTRINRDRENGILRLDRREFLMTGLVAAASLMIPRIALSAPAKQQQIMQRRKIGPLEVSAIGLGCMSMNSGNYNPPKDKHEMIRLIHSAFDRGVTFFDTAEAYGRFAARMGKA